MDMWKFYDITHREHVVCNPTSEEKLTRLVKLLRLPTGSQVVDIASMDAQRFNLRPDFDRAQQLLLQARVNATDCEDWDVDVRLDDLADEVRTSPHPAFSVEGISMPNLENTKQSKPAS